MRSIVTIAIEALNLFNRLRDGRELSRGEAEEIRDQFVSLLTELIDETRTIREKLEENTFAMRTLNETIQEAMKGFRELANLLELKYHVPADKIRDLITDLKIAS